MSSRGSCVARLGALDASPGSYTDTARRCVVRVASLVALLLGAPGALAAQASPGTGADWTPARRVSASFWAYGQGPYHLTDLNTLPTFGGYTAVNADVSVRVGGGVGIGLAVQNAFNRYYEYVWYDGTQTLHSPASTRSVYLTVTFDR